MIKEGQLYRTSDRDFILLVEKVRGGTIYVLVLHRGKVKAAAIPDENFRRAITKNEFVSLEKGEIRSTQRRFADALKVDPQERESTRNESVQVIDINDPVNGRGIIMFKDKRVTATIFEDAKYKREALPPTAPLPISRQDQPNSFFDYTILGMGAYWLDDYLFRKHGRHLSDHLKDVRSSIKDFWSANYPRAPQLVSGKISGMPAMLIDDKELHVAPFQRYSKFNTIFRGSKAPGVDEAVDLLVRRYYEKRGNVKDPNQLTTYRTRYIKSDTGSMVPRILAAQEEKALELEKMYRGTKYERRFSRAKFAQQLYSTPEALAKEYGGLFGEEYMRDIFDRMTSGETADEIVDKLLGEDRAGRFMRAKQDAASLLSPPTGRPKWKTTKKLAREKASEIYASRISGFAEKVHIQGYLGEELGEQMVGMMQGGEEEIYRQVLKETSQKERERWRREWSKYREELNTSVRNKLHADTENFRRFREFLKQREKDLQYSSVIAHAMPYEGILPSIESTFYGILPPTDKMGQVQKRRKVAYPTWYLKTMDQGVSDLLANVTANEGYRGFVRPNWMQPDGKYFQITQMYKAVEQMHKTQKLMILDIETIADMPFEISAAVVDPFREGVVSIRDKAYQNRVFAIDDKIQTDRSRKLFTVLKDFAATPGSGNMEINALEQNLKGVLKKHFGEQDVNAAFLEITRLADLAQNERWSKALDDTVPHPLQSLLRELKPGAEFEQFFARAKTGMGPRLKNRKAAVDFVLQQIKYAVDNGIPVLGHNLTEFDLPRLESILAQHGKTVDPKFYDLLIDMLPAAKLKYKDLSKQYQGVWGNFFLMGRGIDQFMKARNKNAKEKHAAFSDIADTMEVFKNFFSEFFDSRDLLNRKKVINIPIGTKFFAPEYYAGTMTDLPHFWRVQDPTYGGRAVFQRRHFYEFRGVKEVGGKYLFAFSTRAETGKLETSVISAKSPEEGLATIMGTLRVVQEKGKMTSSELRPIQLEKLAPMFGVAPEQVYTEMYRAQKISQIARTFERVQKSPFAFVSLMEGARAELGLTDLPEFPKLKRFGGRLSRRELKRLKDPVFSPEELKHISNTVRNFELFYGVHGKNVAVALSQGEITPYEAIESWKQFNQKFMKKEENFFVKKQVPSLYYEQVNLGLPKRVRDELLNLAKSKGMAANEYEKLTDTLTKMEEKAIKYEKGIVEPTIESLNKYLGQIRGILQNILGEAEPAYAKLLDISESILQEAGLSPSTIKEFRELIKRETATFSGSGVELLSQRVAGAIDSGADVVKTIQSHQERQLETNPAFAKEVLKGFRFRAKLDQASKETLLSLKGRPPVGATADELLKWQAFKAEIESIPEYLGDIPWKYRKQFEHIESVVRAYRAEGMGITFSAIKTPGAPFSHAVRLGVYNPKNFSEEFAANALGGKLPLNQPGFATMEIPLTVQGIVSVNDVERTVGFYKKNLVRDNPYLLGRMTSEEKVSFSGAYSASLVQAAPMMKQAVSGGDEDRARQIIQAVKSRFNTLPEHLMGKSLGYIREIEEKLSASGLYTWPVSYAREFGFPEGQRSLLDYVTSRSIRVGKKPKVTGTTNVVRDIVDKLMEENPDLFGWVKPEHLTQVLSAVDIRTLYPFGMLIPKEEVAKPIWRQLLAGRYLPEVGRLLKEGGTEGISALPPFLTESRLQALKVGVGLNELYVPALNVAVLPGLEGKKFSQLSKSFGNQLERVINYYEANKLGGVTHKTAENAAAFEMLEKLKFLKDTGGIGTVEGMQIMSEDAARKMAHNVPHVVTTAVSPQRVSITAEDISIKGYIERAMKGQLRYGEQVLVKPGQEIATIMSESVTQAGKFAHQIIKNESKTDAYLSALVGREGTLSFHLQYKYPGLRELQKILGQASKGIAMFAPKEFFHGVPGLFPGLVRGGLKAGEAAPEYVFYSGSHNTAINMMMSRAQNIAQREGKLTQFIGVLNKGARDKNDRVRLEKDLFPGAPGRLQPIMSDRFGIPDNLKTEQEIEKYYQMLQRRISGALHEVGLSPIDVASLEFGDAQYSSAYRISLAQFDPWKQRGIKIGPMDLRNLLNQGAPEEVIEWIHQNMKMTTRGQELTKTLYMGLSGVNEQAVRVLRGVDIVDALHENTSIEQIKGKAVRLPVPISIHEEIKRDKWNAIQRNQFTRTEFLYFPQLERPLENLQWPEKFERKGERVFNTIRRMSSIQDRTSDEFRRQISALEKEASEYIQEVGNLYPKELKKAFSVEEIPFSVRGTAMMQHAVKPGQLYISPEMFEQINLNIGAAERKAILEGKPFYAFVKRDPTIHYYSNQIAEVLVNPGVPTGAIAANYAFLPSMTLDFDTDNIGFFVPHGNAASDFIKSQPILKKYSESSATIQGIMDAEVKRRFGEKYNTAGETLDKLLGRDIPVEEFGKYWKELWAPESEYRKFYEKYVLSTGQVTSLVENIHTSANLLSEVGKIEPLTDERRRFADYYQQYLDTYVAELKQQSISSKKLASGAMLYESVLDTFGKLHDSRLQADVAQRLNEAVRLAEEMEIPKKVLSTLELPFSSENLKKATDDFRTALDIFIRRGEDIRTVRTDPLAEMLLASKQRNEFRLSGIHRLFTADFKRGGIYGNLAAQVLDLPGKNAGSNQLGTWASPLETDWANVSKGDVDLFSSMDLTSPIHKFQSMIRSSDRIKGMGMFGLALSSIYLAKKAMGPSPVDLTRPPGYEKMDQLQDEQGMVYDKLRTVRVGMKQEDIPEYHQLTGSIAGVIPKTIRPEALQLKLSEQIRNYYGSGDSNVLVKDDRRKIDRFYMESVLR